MSLRPNPLLLTFTVAFLSVTGVSDASGGSVKCDTKSLLFPFGFSSESPIRFNCSHSGDAKIGDFLVQEVTNTDIIVGIPPECNRDIGRISEIFGENYAPSRARNIILLQGCNSVSTSCTIGRKFIDNRLKLSSCRSNATLRCNSYTSGGATADVMSLGDVVDRSDCDSWFSSITFDSRSGDSDVSLELERVRLVWWMKGGCDNTNCSKKANCTDVNLVNGALGHRCTCIEGFAGDGFADGGCRRDRTRRVYGLVKVIFLGAGIVFGAVLMAALILTCFCIRKRSVSSSSLSSSLSLSIAKRLLSEVAGNSSVPFYTYREIHKATQGFSDENMLGTGAFGTVYAGKLHDGSFIAVKRLRRRDIKTIDQFVNEIRLLSSIHHPNLVRLLGCCITEFEPLLVYEFMPNGTLAQHLQEELGNANANAKAHTRLPWTLRIAIAAQTANAIAHLHYSVNPRIYHRDIKSSNILLDDKFNSKLSDFGLSRLGMTEFEASHISTAPQGTPGYLDPQYQQDFQLSDKSDVYSFGVVLVEILSGMKVIDFSRPFSHVNLATLAVDKIGQGRVEEIVDPYLKTESDPRMVRSLHSVAELAFRCLSFHRDMRPAMMEVAEELERIRRVFCSDIEAEIEH